MAKDQQVNNQSIMSNSSNGSIIMPGEKSFMEKKVSQLKITYIFSATPTPTLRNSPFSNLSKSSTSLRPIRPARTPNKNSLCARTMAAITWHTAPCIMNLSAKSAVISATIGTITTKYFCSRLPPRIFFKTLTSVPQACLTAVSRSQRVKNST